MCTRICCTFVQFRSVSAAKQLCSCVSDLGAVSAKHAKARETGVPAIGYLPLLTTLLIGPRALALEAC